ncbi:tetratricopeptide repeat protein [Allokutzneria albata]|uniref:Tetratricopeptide repeat-containing protein n=1 Tax=Allokutzneria albata TaxID=211114 RepID=A0A1G9YQX7_ALLAB|nr:tetratricopeptide repeat protein [Allokutzneria albata]SDN11410.1 Tetratricopeptide repeat-containing protein [Allokutzneria albata]
MSDGTFEAFRRAEALLARRQPLDAIRALEPVLEHEPNTPSVQLLAARAYFASAQLNRAEAAFRRVVELDPTDHYARFGLGKTLHRQGRLHDAVRQLRIAVAMLPSPDYQEALNEVRARIAVENSN